MKVGNSPIFSVMDVTQEPVVAVKVGNDLNVRGQIFISSNLCSLNLRTVSYDQHPKNEIAPREKLMLLLLNSKSKGRETS